MPETARVLLVAAVLTASGLGVFAWRLARIDPAEPARLIGELRFAQWTALTLAAIGGAWIGVVASRPAPGLHSIDLTIAIAAIVIAAWTLQRETRGALMTLCVAFLVHAIIDTAHRPGWLPTDVAPRWFALGCAAFNLWVSALCYWVQRR